MENQQVEFITNWNCNLRCYGCNAYSHLQKQPKHNNYLLDDIKNWAIKLVPLSENKDINCIISDLYDLAFNKYKEFRRFAILAAKKSQI